MIARRAVLLLPLVLASCGGEPDVESFPAPTYSYLTPLRLNVSSIEVQDVSPPTGSSLEAMDPVRPADALKQMADDRLFADGSAGRAVFVIDRVELSRSHGAIDGMLAVHLDVYAGSGAQRVGFAEARVVRRRTSTDADENLRSVLYQFTLQMMNDMNVEFEYQVRRSLRDWLQATSGAAPLPPPVEAEPLPKPGSAVPEGHEAVSPGMGVSMQPSTGFAPPQAFKSTPTASPLRGNAGY